MLARETRAKIPALTSLRFFAAAAIVYVHYLGTSCRRLEPRPSYPSDIRRFIPAVALCRAAVSKDNNVLAISTALTSACGYCRFLTVTDGAPV
jgi:hypothetical protein